jgi:hypothetical protein
VLSKPRRWVALAGCSLAQILFAASEAPLRVVADGLEVVDIQQGLVWRRCAEGLVAEPGGCSGFDRRFTLPDACAHAQAQARTSGQPWRLPTAEEFTQISARLHPHYQGIDPAAFPNTPTAPFWTSGSACRDAQTVDAYTGHRRILPAERELPLRLVRDAALQSSGEVAAARNPSR